MQARPLRALHQVCTGRRLRTTAQSPPSAATAARYNSSLARRPSARASASAQMAAVQPKPARNLHWVFKVGDRRASLDFYQRVLGMTVLRHEEFEEGCAAACNGPYDTLWSKTMIGYGNEDEHFVLELTYNYGLKSYRLGNDYSHITIRSKAVFASAAANAGPDAKKALLRPGALEVCAPDGYRFLVLDEDAAPTAAGGGGGSSGGCPMTDITLNVTDLSKSVAFWSGFLGFDVVSKSDAEAVLSPGAGQCQLRLTALPAGTKMDHATGYGRIAFACAGSLLQPLEGAVRAAGYSVVTPYVSLDTPGKATVQVVILADPDGHEICFVGDEGFRDLSRQDPAASRLAADAVEKDKSGEWFAKRAAVEAQVAAEKAAKEAAAAASAVANK